MDGPMWSLAISAVVYFVASWYCGRFVKEHWDLEGLAKKMVCFVAAFAFSWLVGAAVDWVFPAQAVDPVAMMVGGGMPKSGDIKEVDDALKALSK